MTSFQSVYSQVFDAVIFGAGYAGFAAACELHERGQSILLVDRRPVVLAESAWAFSVAVGRTDTPQWKAWIDALAQRSGGNENYIDGAIAEVLANQMLLARRLPTLYYATPIAAHIDGDSVSAVAVGVKEGVRVIRGRRFIDATETGELVSLIAPGFAPQVPVKRSLQLFYRYASPVNRETLQVHAGARLQPTCWPNELVLSADLPDGVTRHREAWLPALKAVGQTGKVDAAVVSHGSVVTYDTYKPAMSMPRVPGNVALAVAAITGPATLAARFDMGLVAAGAMGSLGKSNDRTLPDDFPQAGIKHEVMDADVVVAGAGTGGAFASIAAARQGVKVTTIEPLPFVGRIGAGGGIHWYYFGVRGGLQEEVDERTRQIMPLLGGTRRVQGFHPDAKKIVIEQMMAEAGVNLMTGATLYGVQTTGQTVRQAYIATPRGPVVVTADNWIDATGDGDLAAHAGATFFLGRDHDGQLHAYSQSSGRVGVDKDEPRMRVINFDAGFVDPTDTQDLTRARMLGVSHYFQELYDPIERPTYIAPAIGLRQGRQVRTDYVLTLHDLIRRATFHDVVGYTGSHYDNHAIDYEFETDEAMFWVWVCRQWQTPVACEIPYRMILPVGLDNLWIACRAAGVSREANHAMRMQRDMQRLGEVAGLAAALATMEQTDARHMPYPRLRTLLEATGATKPDTSPADSFGPNHTTDDRCDDKPSDALGKWIADMRNTTNASLYHLVKHEKIARPVVMPLISDADACVSWRAAAVAAMWNDPAAEPRLLKAIKERQTGYSSDDERRPESNNRLVPWWMASITLLRRCGSTAMLPIFDEISLDPDLLHNVRTAMAMTLSSLARRVKLSDEQKKAVERILARLLATPVPNAVGAPQRKPSLASQPPAAPTGQQRPAVVEDFSWQLHLAIAQARDAAHLPIHAEAGGFLHDPRVTVRKAFARVLQNF